MAYECIVYQVKDAVATITLNRPDAYNALNLALARDVFHATIEADEDRAVRAILITGAGKAFCAGGDVKDFADNPDRIGVLVKELTTYLHGAVSRLARAQKPVIMAVNGVAAGGGFSLALACDFRIMAASARLKQAFTSNALCIDAGGTFMLPRIVGLARALEIATFDEPIVADRALSWGLVTKVVDDAVLLDEAMQLARHIASKSLHTFGWSKALLTNAFDTPWETQLEYERQGLVDCVAHPDGVEGMHAFLEKRTPRYNQ